MNKKRTPVAARAAAGRGQRKGDPPGSPSRESNDRNIEQIIQLEAESVKQRTLSERIADRVTRAAGSSVCVILHAVWFAVWIILNEGGLHWIKPFDQFPFSLLTLIVSLEAIFLTQLVLMTQNRMTREADKRAHLDLQVNMLAEQEGTMTVRMLCAICEHLGLKVDDTHTLEKLKEETNVGKLSRRLDEHLPG